MRLMISQNNEPSLLVSVADDYNPESFEFRVINGAWNGKFTNGYITVLAAPNSAFSSINNCTISCDNQDRLRGDYDVVFNHFENVDYVAPAEQYVSYADIDDDIPF